MRSWYSITNKSEALAEISIYEEIGFFGITAKDFLDEFKKVGNRRILLRINSPGGDVFEGLPIYNRLKEHRPGVEVRIDGLAASMASVIAMAGDTVKIAENALLMIHNPAGLVVGEAEDMREFADVLDKIRGSLVTAYERKTGQKPAKIIEMMDAETWLNATEAEALGFVDEITEPLQIAARFDTRKFRNAPAPSNRMNPLRLSILAALALTDPEDQPLTDEQITAELTKRFGTITALTTERDTLKGQVATLTAERDTLSNQFAALTTEATQARADLVTANASITSITSELTTTKATLATAHTNIGRLEALCGVKGIDPKAAVPHVPEPGAAKKITRAQFDALEHGDRNAFMAAGGKVTD